MSEQREPGAAIHFVPAASGRREVIGLAVAVEGLVDAYLRYARQERLYCYAADEKDFSRFRERAVAAGRTAANCVFVPATSPGGLREAGCLLRPDPDLAPLAWLRRTGDQDDFSLCGLSHAMSSAAVLDAVGQCVLAPSQSWDAIICPSRAIRAVIEGLWREWRSYLAERTGGRPECPIQLPIIPLGIDTGRFAANRDPGRRASQRLRLGIGVDGFVLLFHGRLSFYAKAHPLPLLMAAERLAARLPQAVHLLFYGHFPSEQFGREFQELAADICHRARVTVIRNGDPDFPDGVWAAADVYVSLSDNIQESFGLAPVEAMASGLPIVISDWNGYRDAITNGVEGFAIPTLAPPAGAGLELALRHQSGEDPYGRHLAATSATTSVDVDAVTEALEQLARDGALRRRMGDAGAARAAAVYDWRHVIAAYEDLWQELALRRKRAKELVPRAEDRPAHPLRPDPYRLFVGFATGHLAPADRLSLAGGGIDDLNRLLRHRMNMFVPDVLLMPEKLVDLLRAVARRPGIKIADTVPTVAQDDMPRLLRTVGWLIKLGYLRRKGKDDAAADIDSRPTVE